MSSPCSNRRRRKRHDKDRTMPQYTPPVRDTRFILDHVVGLGGHANLPGFANATPDVVDAVLDEGGKFVAEVLFPFTQSVAAEDCTRPDTGRDRKTVGQ